MFESDEDRVFVVTQKPTVVEMIYCSSCFKHFGCKTDNGFSFCNKKPNCSLSCDDKNSPKLKLVFGECSGCYAGNPGSFFLLEEGLCIL